MNRWEIWTWVAIAVLIFGSIAAFGWFLRDAVRLLRARRPQRATDDSRFPQSGRSDQ